MWLLYLGMVILAGFIIKLLYEGYWFTHPLNMTETGQIGDFIGGTVGTIWSLSGILFIYATFQQQNTIIQREHDKFLYEVIQKKYGKDIPEIASQSFNSSFENESKTIESYLKYHSSFNHIISLGNLTSSFHSNKKLTEIIDNFHGNLEKIDSSFIKQILKDDLSEVLKIEQKLNKIEILIQYLTKLNEEFETFPKESSLPRKFRFEGQTLDNPVEDSYEKKLNNLIQLKYALIKLNGKL